MPAIDVVSDANIAFQWFHDEDESDVVPARKLLDLHRSHQVALYVLDLTYLEVGNAMLRGHPKATPGQVTLVLTALRRLCETLSLQDEDLALAAELAAQHGLTLYDASYAAVAHRKGATLVTLDRQLQDCALGVPPDSFLRQRFSS